MSTVKASGRYSQPLLGSRHAAGGAFEDAPIELVNRRINTTYFNDFLSLYDFGAAVTGDGTAGNWTVTDIGTVTAGTVAISGDLTNGVLSLVPDATNNEGYHVQETAAGAAGELWLPASGRVISAEFRFGIADVDDQDYFIGLAETSATLMDANGALTSDNFIGFRHLQTAGNGILRCIAAGTASANQADLGAANTVALTNATSAGVGFVRAGFRIEGTNRVKFYFNGELVQQATLATPFDDSMCISFANVGSGAVTDIMYVDYAAVTQTR